MSNIVQALVERRVIGSASRKSVLSYMATRASDDGSGVWTSKANMARDMELSRRTVQRTIQDMLQDGLIRKVGTKPCLNGETDEYCLDIEVIKTLDSTRVTLSLVSVDPCHPVTPTCDTMSPLPVSPCHPNSPRNSPKNSPIKKTSKKELVSEFELLWLHYRKIKKVKKKEALAAYIVARKKASYETISKPLGEFIRFRTGQDHKFTPHLFRWLQKERWTDNQEHAANAKETSDSQLDGLMASTDVQLDNLFPDMKAITQ